MFKTIRKFIQLIETKKEHILVYMLAGSCTEACIPYVNLFFSAELINRILQKDYDRCKTDILLFLSLIAVLEIMQKACRQRMNRIKEVSTRNINEKIIKKAYVYNFEKLETDNIIDILRRTKGTLEGFGGIPAAIDSLYRIFHTFFTILLSLFFIVTLFRKTGTGDVFFSSAQSTVVIIVFYFVISMIEMLFMRKVQKAFNALVMKNDHNNAVGQYIIDTMMNQKNGKDIRMYSLKRLLNHIFEEYYEKALEDYLTTSKKTGKYFAVSAFLGQVSAGVCYIMVGAKAVYGVIGVGDIFLYIGAINSLVTSISDHIGSTIGFLYKWNYLKELADFTGMPDEDGGQEEIKSCLDGHVFEFKDVSFRYPNSEEYVLRHIDLKINAGDKTAVVGYNGAGKTTLVKLLCRLYKPTEGIITIDGVDIQNFKFDEYVGLFAAIFQDFKLFSLSLEDNITSGKRADYGKLWDCIAQVRLRQQVERMKDGLKTQLYNDNGNGVDISGGEAQRFSIARALYKDAEFVIMDEPTAALDPLAEAEIYEQLNEMVKGKTTIFISHRMSSCKFCKNIIVLDKGNIAEQGNHEELMGRKGIYAELFRAQAKYYI